MKQINMKKCELLKTVKKSPFHDENVLKVLFIHSLFVLFLEESKNIQFRLANGITPRKLKKYLFGKNKRDSFNINNKNIYIFTYTNMNAKFTDLAHAF